MTTPQQLVAKIGSVLGASVTPSLTSQSSASDLFEAYILSLGITAARNEGATVTYQTVQGTQPAMFVFRTSPGHIYSSRHAYTHAVLSFPNKPALELHVGVRIAGMSGVLHECDVAVIDQSESDWCRRSQAEPRSYHLKVSIEAKFYAANLGLNLARSFIGLTRDLSPKASPCFVSNITSVSVMRLLGARTEEWQDEVTPGSQGEVRLMGFFQDVFHRYCRQ